MDLVKKLAGLTHGGLSCILIVFSIAASLFIFYEQKKLEQKNERIVELEKDLKVFKDREERWGNMQKTLMVSYNLSKYEARYYSIMFDDFSTKYDVPWEIYPATIWVESNFRTTLVSTEKAKGIGQVLEGTAKTISNQIGIRYKEGETLWNEILNMAISLTYLSQGVQKGGVNHGIKVYLGGPMYKANEKQSETVGTYLSNYHGDVLREFLKVKYIYKGIGDDTLDVENFFLVRSDSIK